MSIERPETPRVNEPKVREVCAIALGERPGAAGEPDCIRTGADMPGMASHEMA